MSALIARDQTVEMPFYVNLALDNGVKPGEISEVITHLAFYAGWGNAISAVAAVKDVFARRAASGPASSPRPRPSFFRSIRPPRRGVRRPFEQTRCPVSPGLVQFTSDLLFHDLWLRPGLAPRDRSLVTISALIASGQLAQLASHLNRAMDNGLSRAQAAEAVTHLAFYAGWPNAFSAVPVVKAVFESRPDK